MTEKLRSTKDLRAFLLKQMEGVADGEIDADAAKSVANLAQQIYNTLNVELKTAVTLSKIGDGQHIKPVRFDE